jgi:hypothetical protein
LIRTSCLIVKYLPKQFSLSEFIRKTYPTFQSGLNHIFYFRRVKFPFTLNKSLWLIPVVVLVYAQVAFCTAALKWDLLDVVFPFRFYFSEAVRSGHFPLWNPYIQTGVPFYADLQAPTYYPELLVVSSLGGYSLYWMHFLVIFYLCIAAFGAFKLLRFFHYSSWSASLSAMAYVCSGYFVGHGQHFFLLVGAAWLPWVIWAYLRLLQNLNVTRSSTFLVFCFLMLTGAYQALSICLFYLLLFLFLQRFVRLYRTDKRTIFKFLYWHIGVAVSLLILLSPLLFAILEIRTEVARLSEGVSWAKTESYGQPLSGLLGFIAPLATAQNHSFFGHIDPSMLHHFVGVIGLLFALFGWHKNRSVNEWMVIGFGVLIGAMSFEFLPVRKWMFDMVPFMNLFLQGAYLRIFMILSLIFLIAGGLESWAQKPSHSWRSWWMPFSLMMLALSFSFWKWGDLEPFKIGEWWTKNGLLEGWKRLDFSNLLGFQLLLGILFLVGIAAVLFRSRTMARPKLWIGFLMFMELFLAAQWHQTQTFVDSNFQPKAMQENLNNCPKGIPIPRLNALSTNDEQHAFILPFWRNTYIFEKQVSFTAFSSFELDNFSYLDDENHAFRQFLLQNPLLYLSDKIETYEALESCLKNPFLDKKTVFTDVSTALLIGRKNVQSNVKDEVRIKGFSPNKIEIFSNTKNLQLLVFQQSYLSDWRAYVDGRETKIHQVNKNYQAILLPQGRHTVQFSFEKNAIVNLYLLSQFLFWILVAFLIFLLFWSRKNVSKFSFALCLFPCIVVLSWGVYWKQGKLNTMTTKEQLIADGSNRDFIKSNHVGKNYQINENQEYETFNRWKGDELVGVKTLRLTMHAKMDTIQPVLVVFEVLREGKSIQWEVMKLERQMERNGTWNPIIFQRNLPHLKPSDDVVFYCWNLSKSRLKLKNVRFDMLK